MQFLPRVRLRHQARIWSLFRDLPNLGPNDEVHSLEIIRSARSGAIKLHEDFKLREYSKTSSNREALSRHNEWTKMTPILPTLEDFEGSGWNCGVTESQLHAQTTRLSGRKDTFGLEDFSSSTCREVAQSEINRLSHKFQSEGIYLAVVLRNAVRNHKPAVKVLANFLACHPECRPAVLSYLRDVQDTDALLSVF